ncbi:hypothetical protein [Chthonobacter rhizosphaerae]|uniref:hypothetical protein n=1 Tax=Chthonobacter rhizosphaerae TaxID=2735553 RepID=UPI0015EEC46D|nr:hypothetical protein [Chthonobacter rhizosphaerae]
MAGDGGRRRILVAASVVAGLCAFVTTALVGIGVGTILAQRDRTYHLERLFAATELTFQAALDPRYQTKAEEIGRVATRLSVLDVVKGGAIFDTSGHLLQTFGEAASTSFRDITANARTIHPTADPARVEFYLSPELTATPFHILTRMDTGPTAELQALALTHAVIISLTAAVGAALGAALVIEARMAAPLRKTLDILALVMKDPALADTGDRLPSDRTEVGRLGAELERFRGFLAEIWRKKVLVAESLLEQSPFAIVQMVADGTPTFANPPANALFDRDLVRSQVSAPLVIRDVESGVRSVLKEHADRFGGECRLVEIITAEGARYAICGGLMVGRQTRTPTYVAMFADATQAQRSRLAAESDLREQKRLLRQSERRTLEVKLSLEACLALMGGAGDGASQHMEVVDFAEEWFSVAQGSGLVTAFNIGKESPLLAGARDDLRAVIRLALLVAYARVGSAPVMMTFDLKGINFETAGLSIKAQRAALEATEDDAIVADWHLAVAALRASARRVGAQIGDIVATDEGTQVRLILKGAAERLQTGMKAG